MMRLRFIVPACLCLCATTQAFAQDAPADDRAHGVVALGVGLVPEFDGSDQMRVLPLAMANVRVGGIDLEARGLRVRADIAKDPRLLVGPVVSARVPRDNADGAIGFLPEIDTAIEAGGFIGYRFGGDQSGQGALQLDLQVVHDISRTHNGLLATVSAGYAAIRNEVMILSFDMQTTWANADYSRTYFGIDPASTAASGLAAYRPGRGFRDVGAGVTGTYWFSRQFGATARIGTSLLVGDIADSPITEVGSRWQPAGGIALSYRF